jgi:hypothetical protein
MAAGFVTLNILDGDGTTRTARFWSSDGTTSGLLYPPALLSDGTGAALPQGHGVAASALRVELPTDGTGVVGLIAGSNIIGNVRIDQTTPGTTNAVSLTSGSASVGSVSLNSGAFDVVTTITRPANTTAYTALDVLGQTGGAALDLGTLGPTGATIQINSVQLEGDIAAIPSGQTTWELHLYSVTPPSALADNAAFDIPSGDRPSYLGFIAIATVVDYGSTLYVEANNIGKQVRLAGTHLFGYLKTVGAFTPAANSEVYKLTLHTVAL